MRDRFDLVIVGSGAGGAPLAYELARAGRSVLVLEKGPLLRTQDDRGAGTPSDFKRDELFNAGPERIITVPGMTNTGASFYASHVEPDLNDVAVRDVLGRTGALPLLSTALRPGSVDATTP